MATYTYPARTIATKIINLMIVSLSRKKKESKWFIGKVETNF